MAEFSDRADAGRRLAEQLSYGVERKRPTLVIGLPRGGVITAAEVAKRLHLPLDVLLVKKVMLPQSEQVVAAIASGGQTILNHSLIKEEQLDDDSVQQLLQRARTTLSRREEQYRGVQPQLKIREHDIILVDDGMSTGRSMEIACTLLKQQGANKITVAVPVASFYSLEKIHMADEIVALHSVKQFIGLKHWYDHYDDVSDDEVTECLQQAHRRQLEDIDIAPFL